MLAAASVIAMPRFLRQRLLGLTRHIFFEISSEPEKKMRVSKKDEGRRSSENTKGLRVEEAGRQKNYR